MAENTESTREIVYYKSQKFYLNRRGLVVSEIEDTTNPKEKRLVSTEKIMSPDEFDKWRDKQRSQHVNWIK